MSLEESATIVRTLAEHGYTADREAVTLLAREDDLATAIATVVNSVPPTTVKLSADDVKTSLSNSSRKSRRQISAGQNEREPNNTETPLISTGDDSEKSTGSKDITAVEMEGGERQLSNQNQSHVDRSVNVENDMTGRSTGTGTYKDFVQTFRDRYQKLSRKLTSRVTHRNATALEASPGGSEAGMIGMINDIRSTANGHWLIELEDTTGSFPCLVMNDKAEAEVVDELLYDEVIAVEGTLSNDGGILFVNTLHFPDVPRTFEPSLAERHVQAALISDVHVGSDEFVEEAFLDFANWLHTDDAQTVEYLLIAGDMVEGVGVYPDQDKELEIVDVYDQYEAFAELLKTVPGDLKIIMIPGNHDAVRLAEPQPGFNEELRSIMSAHDSKVVSNPSLVTVEGVSILMYHGVSLDEIIAELPADKADYENPERAMYQLLKKRHVAPQFGGHTRLAPENQDYLVIDKVPEIFHTGHVHKIGWGKYRNVLAVNSGCWQAQTDFQKSVNIDPDVGFAPIVDLDTMNLTVRKFH